MNINSSEILVLFVLKLNIQPYITLHYYFLLQVHLVNPLLYYIVLVVYTLCSLTEKDAK